MDVGNEGSIGSAHVRSSRRFSGCLRVRPVRRQRDGFGRGRHAGCPRSGGIGHGSGGLSALASNGSADSRALLDDLGAKRCGNGRQERHASKPKRRRHVSRRQPARRLWIRDLTGRYGQRWKRRVCGVRAVRCRESSDDSRRDRSRMFDGDPGRSCHPGKRNELRLCRLEQRIGLADRDQRRGHSDALGDSRGTHPREHHV